MGGRQRSSHLPLSEREIAMRYLDSANRIQANKATETLLNLIDLSPSMEDDDWKPSRKAGAIAANEELIANKLKYHSEDRMGIIGFSGNAELLHPPVCLGKGENSLRKALRRADGSGGTNFTAALTLAEMCFFNIPIKSHDNSLLRVLSEIFIEPDVPKPAPVRNKHSLYRIIMLTDGEHNQGGSPLKIAARLKKAGVVIDCIGIGGSAEKIDEILLKQIASVNPDGSIRYCFIGDQKQLLQEYQTLARHIRAI